MPAAGAGLVLGALLLLGVLALGCASEPEISVAELPPDRATLATDALVKWNTILAEPFTVGAGAGGTGEARWTIREATPPPESAAVPHPDGSQIVGYADSARRVIWIAPGLEPMHFYAVLLHELGHVRGLRHVAGYGVMQAEAGALDFSASDLAECRRAGACD